jgi:hypothetical protein
MPRHFATREEELFKIGMVCFKCLATLLRQGVECGLEDVVLVEVPEFSPFMLDVLEVVNSPVESPKCVATRIG